MLEHLRQEIAGLSCIFAIAFAVPASAERVTVFAAASLKDALEEVADEFSEQSGHSVSLSLAGSSVLSRQISQGAPADVFLSANPDWMDVLEAEGIVEPDARFDLLGNRLVLVASDATASSVVIANGFDLDARLGDGRLAMALVDAVPAGIYGKAALQSLDLWEGIADRVVQVDNVRAALAIVKLGEAEFGVVYATDAKAAPDVGIVGEFPPGSHPPVVYPVARVTEREASDRFLAFLRGPEAREVFERWGFSVLVD